MSFHHGFGDDLSSSLGGPSRYGYGYGAPTPEVERIPIVYLDIPKDLTLQLKWVTSKDIRNDCLATLSQLPKSGEITELLHPLAEVAGRCMIGVYFTDPKPNGDPKIKEEWANVQSWVEGAIELYIPFIATGFSMDFASGLQLVIWEHDIVDLDPKRLGRTSWIMESLKDIINDTLDGNRSGRGRGRGHGRGSSSNQQSSPLPLPPTAVPPSLATATAAAGPPRITDVGQLMPAWTGQPPIPIDDCIHAIPQLGMVSWFFIQTGLFVPRPYVFIHGRCAIGIFLTEPPTQEGQVHYIARDGTNIERRMLNLIVNSVHEHGVPGYKDLPNGMQFAVWDFPYLDPDKQCWKVKRISLKACLNLMAMRTTQRQATASLLALAAAPTTASLASTATLPQQTGSDGAPIKYSPQAGLPQMFKGWTFE